MKIALIQINSGDDKKINFEKAKKYVLDSIKKDVDIVCLSERFLYWGDSKLEEAEKDINSKYIKEFQQIAKDGKVNIILGSVSIEAELKNKSTNSCLIIDRKGDIIHRYDKLYMFNVMKDDVVVKESDSTISGNSIGLFEIDEIKMGVGICYDLRYPEYFQELVKNGAEIIFLPANFRKVTGKIAWDILTKARAIENQVYFCACGQTGETGVKERCGNSRIISYDGEIISDLKNEEGIVIADVNLNELRKFREEFPVLKQIKYFKK